MSAIIMLLLALNFSNCNIQDNETDSTETISENRTGELWVSAYLASWNHFAPPGGNWGNLPTDAIDWDAFSHLFYFATNAQPDGSLSKIEAFQNLNPDRLTSIVSAAHAHNKPILFSVGGYGNHSAFIEAITDANRNIFISNIINMMVEWKFDGVDIDLEPINDEDVDDYRKFITELHSRLQQIETELGNRPLLTAATDWQPNLFAELHDKFDQINLMTYDMSGAWPGWVVWHNAPIFNGGANFPGTNRELPSADKELRTFIKAGIPRHKLGIGIDFYGYVWEKYVTEPLQRWNDPPTVRDNIPYHQIINTYADRAVAKWDDKAKAAYLSIDSPNAEQRRFISYDNERTIKEKFTYAREQKIGGLIIWELSGGFQQSNPADRRDELLQVVKQSWIIK